MEIQISFKTTVEQKNILIKKEYEQKLVTINFVKTCLGTCLFLNGIINIFPSKQKMMKDHLKIYENWIIVEELKLNESQSPSIKML